MDFEELEKTLWDAQKNGREIEDTEITRLVDNALSAASGPWTDPRHVWKEALLLLSLPQLRPWIRDNIATPDAVTEVTAENLEAIVRRLPTVSKILEFVEFYQEGQLGDDFDAVFRPLLDLQESPSYEDLLQSIQWLPSTYNWYESGLFLPFLVERVADPDLHRFVAGLGSQLMKSTSDDDDESILNATFAEYQRQKGEQAVLAERNLEEKGWQNSVLLARVVETNTRLATVDAMEVRELNVHELNLHIHQLAPLTMPDSTTAGDQNLVEYLENDFIPLIGDAEARVLLNSDFMTM